MIGVLVCGDPRENVTQTVTLLKLTGTMRARRGLGRDLLRIDDRADICVCVCLLLMLEVV